jgi:hypothetical protein
MEAELKKITLIFIFIILSSFSKILAQDKDFGLGIIIGEPTGVSAKYWTHSNGAFDGAAAWSFIDEGAFHIHVDYLLHNFDLIKVSEGRLPFYYGIGGRIKASDDARLGVRVPLGLAYLLERAPVDIFLEIVPILDLAPKTDFKINAAIGARYYFKP